TRQKTPEDLHAQVPVVEEILSALKVPILRAEGYEADDLIATLARRCAREERPCYVVSGDKDLLQLVGGSVRALRPQEGMGMRELGVEDVEAEWGVGPGRILDYLSLTGDSSDNVPGVPGVGDKTALKLLGQFSGLDDIYEHLAEVKPDSLRAKLEAGRELAFLSRRLITLKDDMDLGFDSLASLELEGLDLGAAAPLFLREGMKSLAAPSFDQARAIGKKTSMSSGLFDDGKPPADTSEVAGEAARAKHAAPAPSTAAPEYRAIATEAELSALVDACIEAKAFAFDTETDGLDPLEAGIVGFSLCIEPGTAYYAPLRSPDSPVLDRFACAAQLSRLFASGALAIGHNLKFDLHVLEGLGIEAAGPFFDTMVAAWVLDAESNSFSLESLSERLLGLSGTSFDQVVPKGSNFDSVPLEKAMAYAAEDADFTWRLYSVLDPELDRQGLRHIFSELEMPLLPILSKMERRGIGVDSAFLRSYGTELEADLANIQAEVWSLAGKEFNLASTKQLQEVLFVDRKLPVQKRTKTGFSTDTAVLEELAPLDPVPRLILRHRLLSKLKNTYVDTLAELAEKSGRVHTTYIQTGAATGRLSSKDPNLQNIPIREEEGRKIRTAFRASPGRILISADYSQIELVVMAHLSGDENLLKAFREGVDIHKRTAAFIFGVDEGSILPDQRRVAKTINFGVIYGMSAFRLAKDLGISNARAQDFIDAYFSTYPGIAEFIRRTIAETEQRGWTSTLFGRKRKIPGIDSKNKTERQQAQRVAVNTPIQGTAADIVKMAMLRVEAALASEAPEVEMLLQVHDELVFEAPAESLATATSILKREMEAAATLDAPLRVSIESAESWGDMH
ncbi:MAG TPA: DNA polymerase I, partial [Rectinemataceae bacterium]